MSQAGQLFVYVGTYTDPDRNGHGEGIYVYRMEPSTGTLTPAHVVTGVANPSFLALHPSGRFLYSVNGGNASGVSAFARDPASGNLTFLNHQSSEGTNPAYISIDPRGRCVLIANYTGGSVVVLPIETDGRLHPASHVVHHAGPPGPNRTRQEAPHPHMILPDPAGHYVLANDLGLDRTVVYRLDAASGELHPNDPPFAAANPGAGPRHLAFHPNGRFVYVINEIDSTITAFAYDADRGELQSFQTLSTLPAGFAGKNTTAQVVVHPSGRFVYGSNRGHDSIAIFAVDPATGRMAAVGHEPTQGKNPRNFNVDPSGAFLYAANQDSDTIVTFRIDSATGKPTPTGQVTRAGSPVCVLFAQG